MKTVVILIISLILGVFAPQSAVANDTTIVNVPRETLAKAPAKTHKKKGWAKTVKRVINIITIVLLAIFLVMLIGRSLQR